MDFRTEGTTPRFFDQLRYRLTIERHFLPRNDSNLCYHMELPYVQTGKVCAPLGRELLKSVFGVR